MSDITINNAHEESPLAEQVEVLRRQLETARNDLNETIESHRNQRERLNTAIRLRQEQNQITQTQVKALTSLVERMNGTVGDVDQATIEDPYFLHTMRRVFAVARIKGNTQEASHIAYEMDLVDLWTEVCNDSQYEVPAREDEDTELTRQRAIRQIIEWQDFSMRQRHPMEAMYTDLWRKASRIAHQANYCDEFQTIASWFGIPTSFDFTYSGTVRVYVEGWFDVEVEGNTYGDGQPDPYEEVEYDIRDHIDELDITHEWTDYSIND